MSEKMTVSGRLLAADTGKRLIKGLLLPFNEAGRTNRGTITAAKGVVRLPEDISSVVLNLGHDEDRPVGRASAITETDEGLVAEFTVANTPNGDLLLAEAAEKLRDGLSVELDEIVVRAGNLLAGLLTGVGAVVKPAFPSARLTAAEDAGEVEQETDSDNETESEETDESDDDSNNDEDGKEMGEQVTPATVPNDLKASAGKGKKSVGLQDAFQLIAQAYITQNTSLLAALSDVPAGGVGDIFNSTRQPAWLGELWSGKSYQRKYVSLLNQATLSNMKIAGWRWTTKPTMADYSGDKAAVPSNAVAVEDATTTAARLAGGWDIDRAYFDFADSGFIESFFRALTESYARLSDTKALTAITTAATANPTTAGTVPTGVSTAIAAVVDGALAIIEAENTPSFALVSPELYRGVLLTRNDDTLAYMNAALGLEDGTLGSFRLLPANVGTGNVVVGAREAITFYELGETPIRVEAENIANGGRDVGVFGYYASIVNDADAVTLVDTTP